MSTQRSVSLVATIVAGGLLLTACSGGSGDDVSDGGSDSSEVQIVNVVKLSGGDWFNRMEVGNQEWAAANPGYVVTQTAGDDASEEKQIAIINDLLPQQPAALTVVPNSPESLENVLSRAQEAGIVVITHEAPGIENAVANIEAFDNAAYGGFQMDLLAQCMGEEGQYAHMVGSLTVASHNVWADGALAQAEAAYPGIERVTDAISSDEDQETAYQRARELLATYPDISGFIGAASTDIAGIGRAVQEAGMQDDICVVGTSTPSTAGALLEDGSVDVITGWDPALAGEAMLAASKIVLDGGEIVDGMDLGIPGYESITQDSAIPNNFFGAAWIQITSENVADYPF
ncbi:substrate-binding domain-containing protein [Demequina sp. NBRC 110052]|uniref:substrate-binding domain-containing protein n=1 Tax=Demequina sp. NBRC 110052 TaxID=1570341 RepID=UPI000A077A0A|nr:substrate-binding domain-containing protein [Demequina sp. NBRC 110052]